MTKVLTIVINQVEEAELTSGGGTASDTAFTPYGNISATNVQNAIQELDSEKQASLVSGTNIKTVNGTSLLGSGNLTINANFTVNTQSNLDFNGNNGKFFIATISANAAITLANFGNGHYYALIVNSNTTTDVLVTIPTAGYTHYRPADTVNIPMSGTSSFNKMLIAFTIAGTSIVWTFSEELA